MSFNESTVEYAALEWFEVLGYAVSHGPHFAHGDAATERDSFSEVVLVTRQREAISSGEFQFRTVHVIVEKCGRNEDDELVLEFRRICDGASYKSEKLNFEIVFADKKSNSAELQLADLVARPIGLSVMRPGQANRAFDAVKPKLLQRNGRIDGWGLKCFP